MEKPFVNRNVVETTRFRGETLNIMFIENKELLISQVAKFLNDNQIDRDMTLVSVVVHTLKPSNISCVQSDHKDKMEAKE
jgi:hypothetical protein